MSTDQEQQFGHPGEPAAQPTDLESVSSDSMRGPVIHNNTSSQNVVHGHGNIFNYSPSIVYFSSSNMAQQSDVMQAKILAALKSRHVPQAVYSAQIGNGCMEGTRIQVLRDIEAWVKDIKGHQIFWVAGMAGTGKSAVAWTICSRTGADPEILLGGSFFCSRSAGSSAQGDVRCIIPTLVQLLARQSAAFAAALLTELVLDPDVLHQQVGVQVERLLSKPLLALKGSLVPILFVIDALDECGGQLTGNETLGDSETHRIVSDMLEALVTLSRYVDNVPIKFLVTSRPETHIRETRVSDATFTKVLRLHTVDRQQVTSDIQLYISNRLLRTPTLRALFTQDDVNTLLRFCDGLFIVAATALEYALGSGSDVAVARFMSLLNYSHDRLSTGAVAPLDQMYAVILEHATKDDDVAIDKLQNLLQLLAALLSARMTLSVEALADLLDRPSGQMRASMSRLHAVLHVPDEDSTVGLRLLHASFGDYLLRRAPSRISISASLGTDILAHGCLNVMAKRLHFNISESRTSFDGNGSARSSSITLSLEYACLHWAYHIAGLSEPQNPDPTPRSLVNSWFLSWAYRLNHESPQSKLEEKISDLFRPRLMYWLEVMSVLGQVQRAAAMLTFAATTVRSKELARFFRDSNFFVASSQEAIERSASHIYVSALPFADKDSIVYQDFAPLFVGLIAIDLIGITHHAGRLVMTLTGHEGAVNSVAYSPDGRLLCSASADETVRIWDMRTGEEISAPLRSGDGAVLSVAFAPSGNVASGTESSDICVWSLQTAQTTPVRLKGHSDAVSSVLFSSNGVSLTSASRDKTVRLWNASTSQQLAVLGGHTGAVHTVAFSPDNLTLASGSEDRKLYLWDIATGKQAYQSPYHHEYPIHSLCFLPDGQKLAVGCGPDIILCKPQTGMQIATVHSGEHNVLSVRSSADGQLLLSAHGKSIRLSTLPRYTMKMSSTMLEGHAGVVRAAFFSPDGSYMISASDDCTVKIWSTSGQAFLPSAGYANTVDITAISTHVISDSRELRGHDHAVTTVAMSSNGVHIVSGSADQSVRIWDALSGKVRLPPLLGHSSSVLSVAISADGRIIASGSADMSVRFWNAQTGEAVGQPMQGHTGYVTSVMFSPDARLIVSGSDDRTVRIWEVEAQCPSALDPMLCDGQVQTVSFSPNGQLVASGDTSGSIHFWERATGQPAKNRIQSGALHVYSIGFSPCGMYIVSAGRHNQINADAVRIWNIKTGEQVFSLMGHTESVYSATYSPDGCFIATGSADRTIRLWDAVNGTPLALLHGHRNSVHCVAFTPNGRSLISSSWDTTVRVWDLIEFAWTRSVSDYDAVAALSSATLTDGWLQTPSGELLLWVPKDYRKYLYRIRGTPRRIAISAETGGWHRGASWTSCWHKAKSDPQ